MKKIKFFVLVIFAILAMTNVYGKDAAKAVRENVSYSTTSTLQETHQESPSPVNFFEKIAQKVKSITDETPKVNGMALAGFILSLVGLGGLGIIFSAIGLSQINKNPQKYTGKGFAIAGLVLGILEFLFVVIIYTIVLSA